MTLLTDGSAVGLSLASCTGLFVLQTHQVRRFLRLHDGPPLTWTLLAPVALIYLCTAGWLLALSPAVSDSTALRGITLLTMAVPLTLTPAFLCVLMASTKSCTTK